MALSDGLVGYWSPWLGSSGYTLLDRTPYRNHGTLTNMDAGTDWVGATINGRSGYALDFDGVNDYVSLGSFSSVGGLSFLSVSVWFLYLSRTADYGHVFGKNSSSSSRFGLGITGAGTTNNRTNLLATMGNGTNSFGYTTDNFLTDNVWYHAAFVFDGNQSTNATRLRVFVNTIEKTLTYSGTIPATTPSNAASLVLGAETTATFNSNSQNAGLSIHNRALTPSEIATLYRLGPGWYQPQRRRSLGYVPATSNRRRRILCGANC